MVEVSARVGWRPGAYAGFWQRVGAALIDVLLLTAVRLVVDLVLTAIGGIRTPAVSALVSLLLLVLLFGYDVVLTSRSGATLGKRVAGIEVRMPDGTLPSAGVCVGRFLSRFLSGVPFGLGFLWPAFDERKQTWHDKIVSTVVIRRSDIVRTVEDGPPAVAAPGAAPAAASPPSSTPRGGGAPGGPIGETMETARWGAPSRQAPPDVDAPSDAGTTPDVDAPSGPGAPSDAGGPTDAWPSAAASGWGSATPSPASSPAPLPVPAPGRATADPNVVAIERASLTADAGQWLQQVAGQVDARLDRVTPAWRQSPQSDAARACAFGILLGHLARLHPHMTADLSRVAEVHPSFSTLLAGSRLSTLEQIAAEPGRTTAWLGPLIDVDDRDRVATLLA